MAAVVEISATPELESAEPTVHAALQRFEDRLNALQPAEMEAVIEAVTRALSQRAPSVLEAIATLSAG